MPNPLFQRNKIALDALNEELNQPTRDPRADAADFNSPYAAKGTEFAPNKMGSAAVEYLHTAEEAVAILTRLTMEAPEDGDIFALADASAQDLRHFIDRVAEPRVHLAGEEKVDYIELAKALVNALRLLSRISPAGGNIAVFASNGSDDLEDFILKDERERRRGGKTSRGSSRKKAEIQMHAEPPKGAPRTDLRSHLDEDVKKEIETDLKN
jgi:nucleoside-diphosphate-sugar epimerase